MYKFPKRSKAHANTALTANMKNLFELIRDDKMIIQQLAITWMQLYKENDTEAYLCLLAFLVETMGLDKSVLTSRDIESQDMESTLKKIMKKSKDSDEYPLIAKSRNQKTLYLNFQHFWIYLATEAGDLIYDEGLLTFMLNWLGSFSFSIQKPIRHTASLGILSLSQALVDILSKEVNDFQRVQTFIRTEMQTPDTQRLAYLLVQEKDLTQKISLLHKTLDDIYNEVLRFRSLDTIMEVRALCIQALQYMTERFLDKFISAGVLDLITNGIYDKFAEVRLKSLEFAMSLLGLEKIPEMANLFEKQKIRLVEMSHDIDNRCSVLAIKVCKELAKSYPLSNDEQHIITCLVWAENEEIRNAACEFALTVAFKDKLPIEQELSNGLCIDHGKQFDSEKAILKLVKFHIEFNETDYCRIEILIQALWNKTSAVKSWETMCELLKRGEKINTTQLSDAEKKIIVYMLVAGLKFLCNSPDKKQKHIMISFTSTLMHQLPGLLIFYSLDSETLKELVKIPMFLDMSAFTSKDLKEPFFRLLNVLVDLYVKSDNLEIICMTVQSLAKLAREPHTLQKEAKAELVKMIGEICKELKAALRNFALECEETELEKWLIRTESMITVYDIFDDIGSDIFSEILGLITQYLSNGINNSKIANSSSGIMYFYHLWDLNKITKNPEGLEKYCETRNIIIENLTALIAKSDCESEVKFKSFKYLCETLMVVSSQAAFGSPLHYEVSMDIWTTIEEYILSRPIGKIKPKVPGPSNSFYKFGAKDEALKEDADESSQTTCLLIARIISFCPTITTSHLPSSFFAHFGISPLKSISQITKQVITHYKTKESQQAGVFSDCNLFFSIVLESLIKCLGTNSVDDIENMKDLAKKFTAVLGSGAMRPKQADKFLAFILDGISFAFSDKDNFQILEGLNVFLTKNYLSPTQVKELYDRVCIDAERIENKIKDFEGDMTEIMYPIKHFLYSVGKIVGIARQPPILPSEKTKKQIARRREELYKKSDDKEKVVESKVVGVKKSAFNIIEEFASLGVDEVYLPEEMSRNVELPVKRTRPDPVPMVRSIKKASICDENLIPVLSQPQVVRPAVKKSSINLQELPKAEENPEIEENSHTFKATLIKKY